MKRLLLVLALVAGCGGGLTSTDHSELMAYQSEALACIAANPGDKAAQDKCIDGVKARWCAKWQGRFDAGVCE